MYRFNSLLLIAAFACCTFFITALSFAQAPSSENVYEPKSVEEIRAQYNLLVELHNSGDISESVFEEKAETLKHLSADSFGINLDQLDLKPLVSIQKLDWIVTTLYVFSVILVVALFIPFLENIIPPFIELLAPILSSRPVIAVIRSMRHFIKRYWELVVYTSIALLLYFFSNEYIVLLCSIGLGSIVTFSIAYRMADLDNSNVMRVMSLILTLLWSAIAVYFDNHFVGFLATGAFVGSLGFAIIPTPHTISFEFYRHNRVLISTVTIATFFISILAWWLFYTEYLPVLSQVRDFMAVFRVGMTSLVPIVFYIGSCYLAFFYFKKQPKVRLAAEVLALTGGIILLLLSMFYGINNMFWISCFFLLWHIIDKYYELVYKQVDLAGAGMLLALLLGGSGYLVKMNIDFIVELLSPLNL